MSSLMENGTSWESLSASYSGIKDIERKHVSEGNKGSMVSLNSVLPDDILEKIFSVLPIESIIRAACVCKVWYHIIHSVRYTWVNKLPQKPWYFMFTANEAAAGYAYDPVLGKWYNIDLPCIEKSNWFVSSSNGLVCFMDSDSESRIFVCNPIIRDWKRILEPPGVFPDHTSLAISVDRSSHRYTIVVVKSKLLPDDFSQSEISVHTYNSERKSWESSMNAVLPGWRGGYESVICNGVLYYLIHSTGLAGTADFRHRLMMYDISATTPHVLSMHATIPVPCSLTCCRLINLKERLVMVGGIAKYEKLSIIQGIGIWERDAAGEWVEVARVPRRFIHRFGELDDVFPSTGTDDLIFIHSYGATALLVFDMTQKLWKWSTKCPATKRFALQLFTGFCFEPRFEIVS
ncbi:hypothetical protein BHM03_00035103 [Ensete ventricosum]|nr:hypothetical protein BHM03_00035103 [Ensete ventricosum]